MQWYLKCWYFIWFTTLSLHSPTLLFLCNRISSLNDSVLLVNSLYACGFLAMVNFHLLYIYPCWYRAWGNPISLWHRKKPEFQRKKIENTWEQAAESLSLFSSKVLCLYKKDRLSTLSSKDLSVVNRRFSLLVCSLKLHFPIVQCYIKQLKNMVYCSIVVCILKPQEGWEQPHSHWKKK